jgi:Cu+-exporting ATPase
MKYSRIFLTSVIVSLFFISCKNTSNSPKLAEEKEQKINENKKTIDPNAKLQKASFAIEGMTCAIGCAKTIEKELNDTNGVKTATVDFENKTAIVEFDLSVQTPEKLMKIVEKTGDGETYKTSNFKPM